MQPIQSGSSPDAQEQGARPVPGYPGDSVCVCSLLHPLKKWSLRQIRGGSDQHVTGALLRFFSTYCENVYLNPDWWENLSQGNQNALLRRFNDSANIDMDRPKAVLADDGILYKPWTILNRENLV